MLRGFYYGPSGVAKGRATQVSGLHLSRLMVLEDSRALPVIGVSGGIVGRKGKPPDLPLEYRNKAKMKMHVPSHKNVFGVIYFRAQNVEDGFWRLI